MQNIYSKVPDKLSSLGKKLRRLLQKGLTDLKKDFAFHNSNTELLAIWTMLFLTITGLFVVSLKSKLSVILLLLILSLVITLITVSLTAYYLYCLKYHQKKQLLPRAHNVLNKSFKIRSLLRFIKLPSLKLNLILIKNLKLKLIS